MIATVQVGDAIEVSPKRVRGGEDPVMASLESDMHSMLGLPQPVAATETEPSIG